MSSEIKPSNSLSNLKFNGVGRSEEAREILTPQVDPATRMRNIIIAIVALLALGGIVWAGFKDSGKKIFEKQNDTKFQAPDHNLQTL